MKIKDFELVNADKLNRAIYGVVKQNGSLAGGIGEDASDEMKLAYYDRLAGLIMKGEYKVKTGCFWNFESRKPQENPVIIFELRDLLGNKVEVPEGNEIPLEVKAAEIQKKSAVKRVKKVKKLEE